MKWTMFRVTSIFDDCAHGNTYLLTKLYNGISTVQRASKLKYCFSSGMGDQLAKNHGLSAHHILPATLAYDVVLHIRCVEQS